MQNSQQYSQYVVGRDGALASMTASPSASPLLINSGSPGSHHFQGGTIVGLSQQSPILNTLISGQGQHNMFNGMYTSPPSFSNPTTFSTSFNGFMEPAVWFSDSSTQVQVSSNNNILLGENGRVNQNQCSEKKLPFCNSRLGVLEGIGMSSPLPTENFKTSSKDYSNFQSKATSLVDSQNWLCSPGMIGYGNQQNQQCIQQTGFKCNDQYSSCSISQSNTLPERSELKPMSNTSYEDYCCVSSSNNRRSPDKQTMHCSNVQMKSGFSEKEHVTKYPCSFAKDGGDGQSVNHSSVQSKQLNDQDNFESLSASTYAQNTSIHEHSLYSQIPSINNEIGQSSRKQINLCHNNITGQIPMLQQHFHDPGVSCDMMDSCLQANKNRNIKNFNERSSCCNLGVNDDQSVAPHSFALRQSLHCFPDCLNLPNTIHYSNIIPQFDCGELEEKSRLSSTDITADEHLKLDGDGENVKDNSIECSSVAGESDIIVEESEDESDSEISIEEVNKESTARCWVCHAEATSHAPNYKLVRVNAAKPLTSSSQVPVASKLARVFCEDEPLLFNSVKLLCKICLNLLETFDRLETKLESVRNDLLHRYGRKEKVFEMCQDSNLKEHITGNELAEQSINFERPKHAEDELQDIAKPDNILETNEIECSVIPVLELENIPENSVIPAVQLPFQKEITNRAKYECAICNKYFASKDYLGKHQQQHTKKFSFYCDRCGRGFMIRRCLENHLRTHSGEFRYQCEVCGRRFIQRYNLENHLRKHNKQYRVKCKHCGRGFMNANALGVHVRTHTDERPFVCQNCGKSFKNNSNLVAHFKLCSGVLNFHCEKCDKRFSLKSQLKNHVVSKHGGLFTHHCNVCNKGFMKESDCKAHMVSHTGEKNHSCGVCGKRYTSLGNLNQHAAKHKDDPQYKCTECGRGFTRRGALTEHMNHHSGVRAYACGQCEKTFVTRRNLQAHQKWHAGTLKLYTCNVCGKKVKHGLQIHMRTHSGEKPYGCSKCEMAFTVKSTLNKHFKMKHCKDIPVL